MVCIRKELERKDYERERSMGGGHTHIRKLIKHIYFIFLLFENSNKITLLDITDIIQLHQIANISKRLGTLTIICSTHGTFYY